MPKKINIAKQELTDLYSYGFNQIEIGKLYNKRAGHICNLMKKYGIKARSRKEMSSKMVKFSPDQINDIWTLYNAGLNREKIATQLNTTEWAIRKIIEGNCRKRGETHKLNCKINTVPLSYIQEQLILGSLLGDASLLKRKKADRYDFSVGHCLKQKDYLKYKANILGGKVLSFIKDEASYSAGKEFFITNYYNKYELERIHKICNFNGIKTVTKDWCDKLDPMAIAIWFMDDGTSSFTKTSCIKVAFSTLSFTKDQLILLQDRLNYFDIKTALHKHNDGYGLTISVRQISINKFMDLIEPYMVDCMKYKIKRRLNEPNFKFSRKDIRRANGLL